MPKDSRLYMTFPIGFPEHPKVKPLSVQAKWAFVEMNAYSRREDLDGRIALRLARTMWSAKVLAELVDSHPTRPLVLLRAETYVIRDYARHQFTTGDLEELHKKRAEAGSAGGKASANAKALARAALEQNEAESKVQGPGIDLPTLNQSSPANLSTGGVDMTKIIAAVNAHCGRECTQMDAYRIVGTVMERAKQTPRNQTAYVIAAIKAEPFVFQKLLDEAGGISE